MNYGKINRGFARGHNVPPPPETPLIRQVKDDFVWTWIPHRERAHLRGAQRDLPPADFIFILYWASASQRQAVIVRLHHVGGRRHFRFRVSSFVGHCCPQFWLGWGPNRRRSCSCDKGRASPWQMPVRQAGAANNGRLQLDDADVVVYIGTKLHVPAAELWQELVLDVHGPSHLSPW